MIMKDSYDIIQQQQVLTASTLPLLIPKSSLSSTGMSYIRKQEMDDGEELKKSDEADEEVIEEGAVGFYPIRRQEEEYFHSSNDMLLRTSPTDHIPSSIVTETSSPSLLFNPEKQHLQELQLQQEEDRAFISDNHSSYVQQLQQQQSQEVVQEFENINLCGNLPLGLNLNIEEVADMILLNQQQQQLELWNQQMQWQFGQKQVDEPPKQQQQQQQQLSSSASTTTDKKEDVEEEDLDDELMQVISTAARQQQQRQQLQNQQYSILLGEQHSALPSNQYLRRLSYPNTEHNYSNTLNFMAGESNSRLSSDELSLSVFENDGSNKELSNFGYRRYSLDSVHPSCSLLSSDNTTGTSNSIHSDCCGGTDHCSKKRSRDFTMNEDVAMRKMATCVYQQYQLYQNNCILSPQSNLQPPQQHQQEQQQQLLSRSPSPFSPATSSSSSSSPSTLFNCNNNSNNNCNNEDMRRDCTDSISSTQSFIPSNETYNSNRRCSSTSIHSHDNTSRMASASSSSSSWNNLGKGEKHFDYTLRRSSTNSINPSSLLGNSYFNNKHYHNPNTDNNNNNASLRRMSTSDLLERSRRVNFTRGSSSSSSSSSSYSNSSGRKLVLKEELITDSITIGENEYDNMYTMNGKVKKKMRPSASAQLSGDNFIIHKMYW